MNLPPPDDIADGILAKTLEAEVEQAKDTLSRREERLRRFLDEVYDGHSPSHDEHPQSTVGANSIPQWVWVAWVCLMIFGGCSIAYQAYYRFIH